MERAIQSLNFKMRFPKIPPGLNRNLPMAGSHFTAASPFLFFPLSKVRPSQASGSSFDDHDGFKKNFVRNVSSRI